MSDLHLSPTMKRILLEACIITTVAFAFGLMVNYQMVMNSFAGKSVSTSVEKTADGNSTGGAVTDLLYPDPVDMEEIDDLLAEGALLVDARNNEDYKAGHLKSAISYPIGDAETKLEDFMQQVPKDRTLILYCNGFGCPDSFDLGVFLLNAGYQDVLAYEGGYPEWRDAGRPLEKGL
ncbi:Rhodanese-related sulfurtransferase [Malonomonas rubra DSM 5091]|uniref:Rhodanese-related sulfurtransferase n=1 Tax=Malonomonas rubra DSM 5091 TaxID=1122189 RepID=A0A1M6JH65_MALRU|nr:rhodanese-like domain-containing protein [Malonomonas rubra]SHJ46026.1 Rhodanese-related sulfurtransferase [Malonomonas rubra DSM 5091]